MKIPTKYIPKHLSKKDKKKQFNMIINSIKLYKKQKYITRKKVNSFQSKPSKHVIKAKNMFKIKDIKPNKRLSKATGCSIKGLKHIIKKGKGAYYSSGSRPNQTAHSWGIARLASAISGGKSAKVDWHIIKKECNKRKKTYKLAKQLV